MLALVNIALIPYVAIKFPRELRGYVRSTLRCIATGRTSLDWARNLKPTSDVQKGPVPG